MYETHLKTAKLKMVREIKDLQEKNNYIEQIFRALRSGGNGPEVLDRLRNGEGYQAIAESLGQPPLSDLANLSPTSELRLARAIKDYDWDSAGEPGQEMGVIPGDSWTTVTSDNVLIDHLFALYFTWVHPVHMVFSRPHFMASFWDRSSLYCTASLVNAICAMACHLFDTSTDPNLPKATDPGVLREQFMAEARSLLKADLRPTLPIIQTYAVMFMVDLGSGKGSRASFYIRLAANALNDRAESQYSTEVMEVTKWGVYALNV